MRSKASGALVKYRKLVNVEDFSQWTWDEVVEAARKATTMRAEIEEIVTTTYGDYIARLTMASAVKRGGIKEFCEETGLNYGTVKNWRSRYLTAEQKREYNLTEPEPEPEIIVTVDDNSGEDAEPEFVDMFNGEPRKASALETVEERKPERPAVGDYADPPMLTERQFIQTQIRHVVSEDVEMQIASVTVEFHDGESWTYMNT